MHYSTAHLDLASFAERLTSICVNSVTSEQAWSAINYTHSKLRNRLLLKVADKLQLIYINIWTLQKLNKPEITEDKLLEIEDKLMG
jgi:hypothetical protein